MTGASIATGAVGSPVTALSLGTPAGSRLPLPNLHVQRLHKETDRQAVVEAAGV